MILPDQQQISDGHWQRFNVKTIAGFRKKIIRDIECIDDGVAEGCKRPNVDVTNRFSFKKCVWFNNQRFIPLFFRGA